MKIKIIDLLNKIANGEEVPEKIKYKNEIYKRYQNISTNNLYYYQVPNKCKFLIDQLSSAIDLLDEVEILNEAKEDKIQKIYHCETGLTQNEVEIFITENLNQMVDKINELIDAVNELKRNK